RPADLSIGPGERAQAARRGRGTVMSRARKMLGLVVASLVVAYAATARWRSPTDPRPGLSLVPSGTGRPLQARSAPRTDRRTSVHALARLEPAGGLIAVGARPGIRIERVLVAAGDPVQAGQPLAILEGQAEALHQRAQRRNQVAVERALEDRLQPISAFRRSKTPTRPSRRRTIACRRTSRRWAKIPRPSDSARSSR
ncbi:MAG TPA: hypothetical protein VKP69_16275, partial [Isosphaeraceae bacterium]|nr:hypothetical protein [Isosphaeraceae bacterium]